MLVIQGDLGLTSQSTESFSDLMGTLNVKGSEENDIFRIWIVSDVKTVKTKHK